MQPRGGGRGTEKGGGGGVERLFWRARVMFIFYYEEGGDAKGVEGEAGARHEGSRGVAGKGREGMGG